MSGTVSKDEFIRVLEGHVTDTDAHGNETDKQLGRQTADGTLAHRAGWDMTFSAPKSVSIASEGMGRGRCPPGTRKRRSCRDELPRRPGRPDSCQRRTGEHRKPAGTQSFSTALAGTSTPRRIHVIIANATTVEQADGSTRWYSVSNRQLMQHRTTADQVYHNELANQLQERGFEVTLNERGHVEMAQYSQAQLEAFPPFQRNRCGTTGARN